MFLSMAMALALGGAAQADPDHTGAEMVGVAQLYAECAGYYDFIADSQESIGKKQSAGIMRNMSSNAVSTSRYIYASHWRRQYPDGKLLAPHWERDVIAPSRKSVKQLLVDLDSRDDPFLRDSYEARCARLTEMTDVLLKSLERAAPAR